MVASPQVQMVAVSELGIWKWSITNYLQQTELPDSAETAASGESLCCNLYMVSTISAAYLLFKLYARNSSRLRFAIGRYLSMSPSAAVSHMFK